MHVQSIIYVAITLIIAACEAPPADEALSEKGNYDTECELECKRTLIVIDATPTAGVAEDDGPYVFGTLPTGDVLLLSGACAVSAFNGVMVTGKITREKSDHLIAELDRNGISREILVMNSAFTFKVKRQTGEYVSYATDLDCLARKSRTN